MNERLPETELFPRLRIPQKLGEKALSACVSCGAEEARIFRPGSPEGRPQVTSPDAAAEFLVPMLQGLDREHCLLVSLDTKHRLIAITTVSIGSVDHTFMSPREVYRDALLHGASAIMIAHNHPSGDTAASTQDRQITRRLQSSGATLGIDLLDSLIVGDNDWRSLAREGVL